MKMFLWLILALAPIASYGQAEAPLSREERENVLTEVARQIESRYVLESAPRIAEAVLRYRADEEFTRSIGSVEFAKAVNRKMQEVSSDVHLTLHYSPTPLPDNLQDSASTRILRAMEVAAKRANFGFSKQEHLAGNVSLLKLDAFHSPELAERKARAAMAFVADSDALIIDLRENQGGDPTMVTYVCSFFLRPQIHLNDLETRSPKSVRQFWTIPTELELKFLGPLYVLTSRATVSAGEEFAYNLQSQKRATVVGETTTGGAHLTEGIKVHPHFVLTVPVARAVNPVTKTNWEGRGVQPDIPATASDALSVAHEHALLAISGREADPRRKRKLEDEALRIRAQRTTNK